MRADSLQCELSCATLSMIENQMFNDKSCRCDWTFLSIYTNFGVFSTTVIFVTTLVQKEQMSQSSIFLFFWIAKLEYQPSCQN